VSQTSRPRGLTDRVFRFILDGAGVDGTRKGAGMLGRIAEPHIHIEGLLRWHAWRVRRGCEAGKAEPQPCKAASCRPGGARKIRAPWFNAHRLQAHQSSAPQWRRGAGMFASSEPPSAYFFFSPIFNVGAAAIVFGFSFFGFFASLFPRR
jgi:hypothetical protein